MLGRPKNKNKKFPYLTTPLCILVLVALIAISITYVWQISQVSTQGYYLKDLEKQISVLQQQNEKLSLDKAELNSLARIETVAKTLGMINNDKVVYLTNTVDVVALK